MRKEKQPLGGVGEHAKFSPSSAHRWTKCTASPTAEAGKPDSPTKASATGTIYHAVAERAMIDLLTSYHRGVTHTGGVNDGDVNAGTTEVLPAHPTEALIELAINEAFTKVVDRPLAYMGERDAAFIDDADYDTALDLLLPYIVDCFDLFTDLRCIRTEAKVVPVLGLADLLYGTVDFHGIEDEVLHLCDLKTGFGPVSPNDNEQLKTYALGCLNEHTGVRVKEVRLYIHQQGELKGPWSTTPGDLVQWSVDLTKAVNKGRVGGDFVAGPHCKWCKAKSECGAYADRALDLARSEFGDLPDIEDEVTLQKSLNEMSGDDLAALLQRCELIAQMADTAREVAARRMYDTGLQLPGYKLTRRVKHKAWLDKGAVVKKFGEGAYGKPPVLTPAQAIKKFGEEECADLWHTPEGELAVAHETAKGQPVAPRAAADFTV